MTVCEPGCDLSLRVLPDIWTFSISFSNTALSSPHISGHGRTGSTGAESGSKLCLEWPLLTTSSPWWTMG